MRTYPITFTVVCNPDGTEELTRVTLREPEGLRITGVGNLITPLSVEVLPGWKLVREEVPAPPLADPDTITALEVLGWATKATFRKMEAGEVAGYEGAEPGSLVCDDWMPWATEGVVMILGPSGRVAVLGGEDGAGWELVLGPSGRVAVLGGEDGAGWELVLETARGGTDYLALKRVR